MYKIKVSGQFSAAHALHGYKGKCEKPHGHNWKVEVSVAADKLDKIGMAIDFTDVKKKLNAVLKELDHADLCKHCYFKKVNSTSENIAKFIYDKLSGAFKKTPVELIKVTVWETDNSCASYSL